MARVLYTIPNPNAGPGSKRPLFSRPTTTGRTDGKYPSPQKGRQLQKILDPPQMNDNRRPLNDIKNYPPSRTVSKYNTSLRHKCPKVKKMPTQKDPVYSYQSVGNYELVSFGGTMDNSLLKQTKCEPPAPHRNLNRSSPYPDLMNRPESPYRRTEEVKSQLSRILGRPERNLTAAASMEQPTVRVAETNDRSRVPLKSTHGLVTSRPSSCGIPSLRQRLELNKESMKLLVENSPFSKSRAQSADSVHSQRHSQYAKRNEPTDKIKTCRQNNVKPSYGTSQYIYKLFTADQRTGLSENPKVKRSRSQSSRSTVFSAGQSLPLRLMDQTRLHTEPDSDSALETDSIQSTETTTDGSVDDDVLLKMLCKDLGMSNNGAMQGKRYQRDSDVDSGITNPANDNFESTSSNDSDIFNRAMCQPTRPSSVPLGSQSLRPSSRQPFKMIKTGPMKADHNLQPISSLGCISNKPDVFDNEVEYWNTRDQTIYPEKENVYKPCVKNSTTRKRNSPTQNLRVRFQDECTENDAIVKKSKDECQGQEKRSRTSSSDDEYSSDSTDMSCEDSEDYRVGHVNHRATVVMVSGEVTEKGLGTDKIDEVEQSCKDEPVKASSIINVQSCERTVIMDTESIEPSANERCSRKDTYMGSQSRDKTVCQNRVKSASLTRLSSRNGVCATGGADLSKRCPSPMDLCSNGAVKENMSEQLGCSSEGSQGKQQDFTDSTSDLTSVMSPERQQPSCFSSNLQSTKSLSGSRTSLSEKMDNFKAKAKTKFHAIRRACSLESLDRKSRSGSVEFGQMSEEKTNLKKTPSLTSIFKFGSGKKRDRSASRTRKDSADSCKECAKASSFNLTVSSPARPIRSATPEPVTSPTASCLPVSTSKLGRALMMRSQSLSDVSTNRVEELKNFRQIGKLVSLNADGSQTILLNKPPHGPFGFYIARGNAKYKHGIFISRLTDGYPNSFFAGLLGIGDEILEINSVKTRSMSLDDVYDVMASKETLLMKIVPLMSRTDV